MSNVKCYPQRKDCFTYTCFAENNDFVTIVDKFPNQLPIIVILERAIITHFINGLILWQNILIVIVFNFFFSYMSNILLLQFGLYDVILNLQSSRYNTKQNSGLQAATIFLMQDILDACITTKSQPHNFYCTLDRKVSAIESNINIWSNRLDIIRRAKIVVLNFCENSQFLFLLIHIR